jgi:GNAT superfamily N-acetyltransferase
LGHTETPGLEEELLVLELRPASAGETATWRGHWEDRLRGWYADQGYVAGDVERIISELTSGRDEAKETWVWAGVLDGQAVGLGSVSLYGEEGRRRAHVDDVWLAPPQRGRGLGTAARAAVEGWARERGARTLTATIAPGDPAQRGLFRAYALGAQRMAKRLDHPPTLPTGVHGREMTGPEYTTWHTAAVAGYADQISASGLLTPDEARSRSETQFAELLPDGLATRDHSLWSLEAGGDQVATLWLCHHQYTGRTFVYNVEASPQHRGKGYGRAAMRWAEIVTLRAGDEVLGLNVFGQNAVAIGLYTSLGYHVTDESRSLSL